MANWVESKFGVASSYEPRIHNFYEMLEESYGAQIKHDLPSIFANKANSSQLLETVNEILGKQDAIGAGSGIGARSSIILEDGAAIRMACSNVVNEMLTETTNDGFAALKPISLSSFGLQIRSYIKAQMHRAVKTVQVDSPAFKIREKKEWLVDIAGNKRYFVDAFNYNSDIMSNVCTKKEVTMTVPLANYDIFSNNSIDSRHRLSTELRIKTFTAVESNGTTAATAVAIVQNVRDIDLENGRFSISVRFGSDNATAIVSGEIDFANTTVVSLSSTSPRVKTLVIEFRLSSETHIDAMQVGMEFKNQQVNIPDGFHIEVAPTMEQVDDAGRMLGMNIWDIYTQQMGTASEKLEDLYIYEQLKELDSMAIVKDTFDCVPETGYAYGNEAWLKAEFHPFIERICIRMKSQLHMDDCHFRVIGNPIDIRIPATAQEDYIFKRNQEMTGGSRVDYDFACVTGVNTIFYMSTERVAPGKLRILLIPNTIENNMFTVMHFRYANYVSNKFRSSKNPAHPAITVSNRYKFYDYQPVLALVTITSNRGAKYFE